MSAGMMSRESAFHARHCMLCADICKACEELGDDAQLKACADACRSCAQACRTMGAHH